MAFLLMSSRARCGVKRCCADTGSGALSVLQGIPHLQRIIKDAALRAG